MAIFKHGDIESVMPPEVRRRAHNGVGKGKVDWYAGRRYSSNSRTGSSPGGSPGEQQKLDGQMRKARQEVKDESATQRRERLSRASHVIADTSRQFLALTLKRLHRYVADFRTHQQV